MEVAVVIPALGLQHHERFDYGTSVKAEWVALILAMHLAKSRGLTDVFVRGDSQLVINQANGVWKCKDASLKVFLEEFRALRREFHHVVLEHIPRDSNLAGHHIEFQNPRSGRT